MRDLLVDPAWQAEDVGHPLPDSPHACSVALPTWDSVVGYEEGRDKVIRRLRAGYPRFVPGSYLTRLTAQVRDALGGDGEEVFLFPTKASAQRAQRWIEREALTAARSLDYEGLSVVAVSAKWSQVARDYQRFTGEMLSSRMAEDHLAGEAKSGSKRHLLERRLARLYGADPKHVVVFSTGMGAAAAVLRSLRGVLDGKKTLQLEFPYVDALKLQEAFGNGVVFLNESEGESFEEALRRIRHGEFAGVFTEVPSNPLLRCADIPEVAAACREGGVPLIIDDSAVGPSNVKALEWADVVTSSLTKWPSGQGDVMGGVAVVRADSPFVGELLAPLRGEGEVTSPLYVRDTEVMLSNLKGFPERLKRPDENARHLVDRLQKHPAVAKVWHPSCTMTSRYRKVMNDGGGYGPLLSFLLKAPKKTPKFFDALRVCKGPSFGTPFTLACPYMLLAHYRELDWAEGCGVPSQLIRVSCGQEDPDALGKVFEEALAVL